MFSWIQSANQLAGQFEKSMEVDGKSGEAPSNTEVEAVEDTSSLGSEGVEAARG